MNERNLEGRTITFPRPVDKGEAERILQKIRNDLKLGNIEMGYGGTSSIGNEIKDVLYTLHGTMNLGSQVGYYFVRDLEVPGNFSGMNLEPILGNIPGNPIERLAEVRKSIGKYFDSK